MDWREWFRDDGPRRPSRWDDKYGLPIVVALTAVCVVVIVVGLLFDW
jgi:hypothetical protein